MNKSAAFYGNARRASRTLMLAHFAIHFGLTGEEILTAFGESLLIDLSHLGLFRDEAFASLWAIDPKKETITDFDFNGSK